ncbi:MAG: ABC transporter substrate-binding protein [Chloroflexi bacterium]|nr:ABC transporter substrate-binding protein [Chloroflexota bacterium]
MLLKYRLKHKMAAAFGLVLLLALACGAPAAPSGMTPSATGSDPGSTAPAAAVPQQPVVTVAPAHRSERSSAASQPAAPAAANVLDRPTLKAGVIWLDSPLDPVQGGWIVSQSGMSENLFRLSASDLSPGPWLATGAEQIDPLTWEIELRSGVKFHNGAAMDALAVKASLERTIRMSEASADALGIDNIVVNDPLTITITTLEPRPTLPGLLTTPAVAITDASAADAAGEGNFLHAGALTGPYVPTEYLQKERLGSVANDDYWGGTPPLAGIEHIAIPDTNSRELALQAGDIDVAVNISPEGAQTIDAHLNLQTRTGGFGTAAVMWWVNFERPALADPLVRRALSLAIDRESIAGLVAPAGSGSFAELLLPEALVPCPGVSAPGYDPGQARDLLAEAGYVDTDGDGFVDKAGEPLEIVIGGYPQRFQLPIMAEAAQAMLADVGIKAEVLITEWSVVKEPGWDLFGWYNNVVDTGDPILNISKFVGVSADASGSGANNYGHFAHPELESIIASAAEVSDTQQRQEIACRALDIVASETALLPVAHAFLVYGVNDRIAHFEPHPTNLYFFDHRIGLAK